MNKDRISRVERMVEEIKKIHSNGIKSWAWGMCGAFAGRMILKSWRLAEGEAVNIAMYYPEADKAWVKALVARANEVASHRTALSHEHHTALAILKDLHYRVLKDGVVLPFGSPEEMIPE